ncbi:MAG: type II secretion system minor pseudopilin GspK [Oceanococcus sp.]
MTTQKAQRGVALITAVMIVAFASTIGAALMVSQNLAVHRSANLLAQDQAWWYLVGLEQWAATLLDRDREDNEYDHFGEPWAQAVDFLPVDEGVLAGEMIDLQGRFNLNSLLSNGAADAERVQQFIRLLNNLAEIKSGQAEDLASAIIDWMDNNTEPSFPGGAEDGVYLGREVPYRTANLLLVSVSELLLIEGMTAKLYAELKPLVAVRPGDHRINVNTAAAAVLMSLSDKMTLAQADAIISKRAETPYETDAQFVSDSLISGMGITTEDTTVSSTYFQAETMAVIGNVRLSYVSLLHRPANGKTRVLINSRNSL